MSEGTELAVPLSDIASCFEGVIPSPLCTCSADGVPNVTYLSIVRRVDADHVALSFQFFNKSRKNLAENPRAQVVVVEPETIRQYRLDLVFETSLTEGPLFERMRTQLDAVASQTGMSHVFALKGADVYRVVRCTPLHCPRAVAPRRRLDVLPALDAFTRRVSACHDLETLLSEGLSGLEEHFGYEHSFLLAIDEERKDLYTVASHGYPRSGVGSEVAVGQGIIGVAAQRRAPVRQTNMARELVFSRAVRAEVEQRGDRGELEKEIPLPGLPNVQSQLAAPLLAEDEIFGVLCLQSDRPGRFRADDEQAVLVAARQIAASMALLRRRETHGPEERAGVRAPGAVPRGETATVKHYRSDDSIFLDDAYLIKGLPGRILWKLLRSHREEGRVDFTNKEIRVDASLQLPEVKDNLETRLILLRRRLQDRCCFLKIVPVGRGRFRLDVDKPLRLEDNP